MKPTVLLHNTRIRNRALMLVAALGLAAVPTKAMAHQVQTNYFLNGPAGDSLELQTTFSNGQPLKGAKVTVYAPDQPFRAQITGKTDNQGRFTFTPDQAMSGDWEVNIERAGHQDILTVPVTEAGIEINELASVDNSDVHYASSPVAAVGSVAIALACLGFVRFGRKRTAE